jgi:hypothetical protein
MYVAALPARPPASPRWQDPERSSRSERSRYRDKSPTRSRFRAAPLRGSERPRDRFPRTGEHTLIAKLAVDRPNQTDRWGGAAVGPSRVECPKGAGRTCSERGVHRSSPGSPPTGF